MGCNSPCSAPCDEVEWTPEQRVNAILSSLWDCQDVMRQVAGYLEGDDKNETDTNNVPRVMRVHADVVSAVIEEHAEEVLKFAREGEPLPFDLDQMLDQMAISPSDEAEFARSEALDQEDSDEN